VEKASGELHVGDRIIEVNGEPVKDQSLAEVGTVCHHSCIKPNTIISVGSVACDIVQKHIDI